MKARKVFDRIARKPLRYVVFLFAFLLNSSIVPATACAQGTLGVEVFEEENALKVGKIVFDGPWYRAYAQYGYIHTPFSGERFTVIGFDSRALGKQDYACVKLDCIVRLMARLDIGDVVIIRTVSEVNQASRRPAEIAVVPITVLAKPQKYTSDYLRLNSQVSRDWSGSFEKLLVLRHLGITLDDRQLVDAVYPQSVAYRNSIAKGDRFFEFGKKKRKGEFKYQLTYYHISGTLVRTFRSDEFKKNGYSDIHTSVNGGLVKRLRVTSSPQFLPGIQPLSSDYAAILRSSGISDPQPNPLVRFMRKAQDETGLILRNPVTIYPDNGYMNGRDRATLVSFHENYLKRFEIVSRNAPESCYRSQMRTVSRIVITDNVVCRKHIATSYQRFYQANSVAENFNIIFGLRGMRTKSFSRSELPYMDKSLPIFQAALGCYEERTG